MRERRDRGVAESEAADHDVPLTGFKRAEPEVAQRDFHDVKQARHEKRVAEVYLVDVEVAEHGDPFPPQGEFAERRLLEIQLFEHSAHRADTGRWSAKRTL